MPEYVAARAAVKRGRLTQVAVEVGLMAEQPLVAHSGQRRLACVSVDQRQQGGNSRAAEHRLEDSPDRPVGEWKAFNARRHD